MGFYAVVAMVNDLNYQGIDSAIFEITIPFSVGEDPEANESVWADQHNIYINMNGSLIPEELEVINIQGQHLINAGNFSTGLNRIAHALPPGVYFAWLKSGNQADLLVKFVIP
jgi:hypothetical protein